MIQSVGEIFVTLQGLEEAEIPDQSKGAFGGPSVLMAMSHSHH